MLVLETRSLFFARKLAEKKSTRFPKQTLDKSIFTARIEVFTHFSDYELGNETFLGGSGGDNFGALELGAWMILNLGGTIGFTSLGSGFRVPSDGPVY